MKASEPVRDLVMIHGAWQGSWAWAALIPKLEASGFRCHAVDMPGNGHDRTRPEDVSMAIYMAYLRGVLDGIGGPVIVIGHSSGGIIASQLGEEEAKRVKSILYIAGMMLPSGMKFAELVANFPRMTRLRSASCRTWPGQGTAKPAPLNLARPEKYSIKIVPTPRPMPRPSY